MFKIKNKKGMTLIEVVVLIAIIGIISAISIVSLVDSKKNSELDVAAEELVAVIREVQNYSLTGKQVDPVYDVPGVFLIINNPTYSFRRVKTIWWGDWSNTIIVNEYKFKNGVVPGRTEYVNFNPPHGQVYTNVTTQITTGITWRRITLSKGGKSIYVCFNDAGLVKKSFKNTCE